jgi:hypothetical protein
VAAVGLATPKAEANSTAASAPAYNTSEVTLDIKTPPLRNRLSCRITLAGQSVLHGSVGGRPTVDLIASGGGREAA